MKTYSFSKVEVDHLMPVVATRDALDRGIQDYLVKIVFPRLDVKNFAQAQYNMDKGELYLLDADDLIKEQDNNIEAVLKSRKVVESPDAPPDAVKEEIKKEEPKA